MNMTSESTGNINENVASALNDRRSSVRSIVSVALALFPGLVGTLSANNYVFTFVNGVMTVSRANTTTTPANVTVQTGAASATLTATVAAVFPSIAIVN